MRHTFAKGSSEPIDYPVRSLADLDPAHCRVASPRVGKPHGLDTPTFPGEYQLDVELNEVLQVRQDVKAGTWPGWFLRKHGVDAAPSPLLVDELEQITERFGVTLPEAAAHVVHMDAPTDLAEVLAGKLVQRGYSAIGAPGYVDFLENIAHAMCGVGPYVAAALEAAFEAKWFFGRPRPEEIVGANITHYAEGCPVHPAYPAGHGAAAGAVAHFIIHYFDLPADVQEQVIQACAQWAMFRTFAGVHFADDNIAGFYIGWMTAERMYA